jgi:hypothetical protein
VHVLAEVLHRLDIVDKKEKEKDKNKEEKEKEKEKEKKEKEKLVRNLDVVAGEAEPGQQVDVLEPLDTDQLVVGEVEDLQVV